MGKHVFELVLAILLVSQSIAQLFGGGGFLPNGGMGGYKYHPVWRSLPGNFDGRNRDPASVDSGAHFKLPNEGFAGGRVVIQPGVCGMGSLYGKVNVFDTLTDRLDVQGHHDQYLNRDFRPVGNARSQIGANYKHAGGATALISSSKVGDGSIHGSVEYQCHWFILHKLRAKE
ncbi:hypothetical protein PPYR_07639 [Photinus pyralis]|uniref:Uncharacterized protein n=1 Tax=Photinus pyralis TaxID=7054 RepID=A0A5N4AR22_PHOPY|nr:hypothetical protein PPYR_07639 [Photinus pyralis]